MKRKKGLKPRSSYLIPMVIEESAHGERAYDIYSRLLKDRIVFLGTEIDADVASNIIAQFLLLELESKKDAISFYILSPGGDVSATMAIYDTMQNVPNEVETFCLGEAHSGAALLLAAGAKGKRHALPSSRIMIHQPWGGVEGDCSNIQIQANEINEMKMMVVEKLALHTGRKKDQVEKDCDRDHYLSAEQAKAYGLIDKILMPSYPKRKSR